MRRSLATGGSTTELSATDAWAHAADGDVAKGRADRCGLQGNKNNQRQCQRTPLVRFVDSGGWRGPTRLTRRGSIPGRAARGSISPRKATCQVPASGLSSFGPRSPARAKGQRERPRCRRIQGLPRPWGQVARSSLSRPEAPAHQSKYGRVGRSRQFWRKYLLSC